MTEEYHRSMIFSIHRFIMRLPLIQFNHRNQLPLRTGICSSRKDSHDGKASDEPRHKQHLLSTDQYQSSSEKISSRTDSRTKSNNDIIYHLLLMGTQDGSRIICLARLAMKHTPGGSGSSDEHDDFLQSKGFSNCGNSRTDEGSKEKRHRKNLL